MNSSHLTVLVRLLLALLLSGCATHEMVLSKTLAPVLSDKEINFRMTLFRARVQMGVLEVWGRVERSDAEYRPGLDYEIESTAALCAALARSDLTFQNDWYAMALQLTNEYGSQWRWKNTLGYTKVRISREALQELRERNAPAAEYPRYWRLFAYKVGPPDYVPQEAWVPPEAKAGPTPDEER